jgi:hypothetical protein
MATIYALPLGLVTISPQFMQRTYDIILSSIWYTCLQLRHFICIIHVLSGGGLAFGMNRPINITSPYQLWLEADPGSSPPEVSNLPYLVYYYYSIYRDESVNGSADGAYTPMRIGIPAHNLCKWTPCEPICCQDV